METNTSTNELTEIVTNRLEAMTVGRTTTIRSRVVTRHSVIRWEVGTFGRDSTNLTETLVELGCETD